MVFSQEFVSNERREFTFKLGTTLASALAGFVGGVIVAAIIFLTLLQADGQTLL